MSTRLVIAIDSGDGAGKSTLVATLGTFTEFRSVRTFHHRSPRAGTSPEDAARDFRRQRATMLLSAQTPRFVIADRWWMSTLALSVVVGNDADAAGVSDTRHAAITARARELRAIALDERDAHEALGVRVVAVYLRAPVATLRERTSPERRGGARWRALDATHAAYEALAASKEPRWFQHVVDATQPAAHVAADVAAIVRREMRGR